MRTDFPLQRVFAAVCLMLGLGWAVLSQADTVHQTPDAFLAEAFGSPPAPAFIWLTADVQAALRPLLGHAYPQARVRYWRTGDTSAWILEEIGKEYPMTAGFIVRDHRIVHARLLVYRESRGGEIHLPAFLRQFDGAGLDGGGSLTRRIDGITGATVSVDAMQRMARTALYLSGRLP